MIYVIYDFSENYYDETFADFHFASKSKEKIKSKLAELKEVQNRVINLSRRIKKIDIEWIKNNPYSSSMSWNEASEWRDKQNKHNINMLENLLPEYNLTMDEYNFFIHRGVLSIREVKEI